MNVLRQERSYDAQILRWFLVPDFDYGSDAVLLEVVVEGFYESVAQLIA